MSLSSSREFTPVYRLLEHYLNLTMTSPEKIRYTATYPDFIGDYAFFNPLREEGCSGSENSENTSNYGPSSGVAAFFGVRVEIRALRTPRRH